MLNSKRSHSGSYIVTGGVIMFLIVGCFVTFYNHDSDTGTREKEKSIHPSITLQAFADDVVNVGDEFCSADGRTTSLVSNAAIATSDAIVASLTMVGMVPSLEVSKVGGDTARFKTARRKLPATAKTLTRTQSECHRHPVSETGLRLHATSVPVPTVVLQSRTSAAQLTAHSIPHPGSPVDESDMFSTVVTALALRREQRVSQQHQNTNPISIFPSTFGEPEQFTELDDLPNPFKLSVLLDESSLDNTCLSHVQRNLLAIADLESSGSCSIGVGSEEQLPQVRLPVYKECADESIIQIGVNDTHRVGLSNTRARSSSVLPDSQVTFHVSDGDSHRHESRKAPYSDSVHPCSYASRFERREEEDPLPMHYYPQFSFSPEIVAGPPNQADVHQQGLAGPIQTIEFVSNV
jgi:hypothetical protein